MRRAQTGLGKIQFSLVTPYPWLNHKPGHFPVEQRAAEFFLAEPNIIATDSG
jgi:hypothetical protein